MFNCQNFIVEKIQIILKKIASSNSRLIYWKTLINSFGEIIGIIVIALMLIVGAFLLHHRSSFISYLLMYIFIAYRFSSRLQIFMSSIGEILSQKGYSNVDCFSCLGQWLMGLSRRGHPSEEELAQARDFAKKLKSAM